MPLEHEDQRHLVAAHGYCELEMFLRANDELEEIEPDVRHLPEVLVVRLMIYQGLKKWELAQAVAKKLADYDPENSQWPISWAYATRRAESIAAAKTILLDAAEKHPKEAMIHFNLACYDCQLGDLPGARKRRSRSNRRSGCWHWVIRIWSRCGRRCNGMIEEIIAGAQTGADRAALDVAIGHGFPHSGWCPKARKAEDGPIGGQYKLTETPSGSYLQRTEWNVRDSDGTVIFTLGAKLSGGSLRTHDFAMKHRKPCFHMWRGGNQAALDLQGFVKKNGIKRLNVAGSRESKEPGIHLWVMQVIEAAFF